MKKEIMNLINTKVEGISCFRLNNVSYLTRWTKDGCGNDVDCLALEFDTINGVNFSLCDREIKSRDYEGIILECQRITEAFFAEIARTLKSNLQAGYRNVSKNDV